ncbi:MAG TPA: endonuclease III [Acidimicrobiales bacterium]|nr:endonuclease III [Acidimicrobiales bacterium]
MPPRRKESRKALAGRAVEINRLLADAYPGTAKDLCELKHRTPFQLLVATILSAQCTDERVNMVTPGLFKKYRTPAALAAADRGELEKMIQSTGFFRSKSNHLLGMAQAIAERFPRAADFPSSMEDLTSLPGVGRKTANVVRSVALSLPGLPVDTHVLRLSKLLRLTAQTDPVKVETDLGKLLPPEDWGAISLRLILHGRRVCIARRPRCTECVLADLCPSANLAPPAPKKASAARKSLTDRSTTPRASR